MRVCLFPRISWPPWYLLFSYLLEGQWLLPLERYKLHGHRPAAHRRPGSLASCGYTSSWGARSRHVRAGTQTCRAWWDRAGTPGYRWVRTWHKGRSAAQSCSSRPLALHTVRWPGWRSPECCGAGGWASGWCSRACACTWGCAQLRRALRELPAPGAATGITPPGWSGAWHCPPGLQSLLGGPFSSSPVDLLISLPRGSGVSFPAGAPVCTDEEFWGVGRRSPLGAPALAAPALSLQSNDPRGKLQSRVPQLGAQRATAIVEPYLSRRVPWRGLSSLGSGESKAGSHSAAPPPASPAEAMTSSRPLHSQGP